MSTRSIDLRRAAALAAPFLAIATASCGVTTDQRACPAVEVIGSLNRQVQFAGPGRTPSDVAYVARIGDVRSRCTYEESNVSTEVDIAFVGNRGPAGARLPSGEIDYFVAVIDAQRHIITKQLFSDRLAFDERGQARLPVGLEQKLPNDPMKSASDHSLIVGFQLTAEQVNFNETQPDR